MFRRYAALSDALLKRRLARARGRRSIAWPDVAQERLVVVRGPSHPRFAGIEAEVVEDFDRGGEIGIALWNRLQVRILEESDLCANLGAVAAG